MSYNEYANYYSEVACNSSTWADPEPTACGCRGCGYWLSEVDTWHACPFHNEPGSAHPEDEEHEDRSFYLRDGDGLGLVAEFSPRNISVKVMRTGFDDVFLRRDRARDLYRKLVRAGWTPF
jgi:hypothetical protein